MTRSVIRVPWPGHKSASSKLITNNLFFSQTALSLPFQVCAPTAQHPRCRPSIEFCATEPQNERRPSSPATINWRRRPPLCTINKMLLLLLHQRHHQRPCLATRTRHCLRPPRTRSTQLGRRPPLSPTNNNISNNFPTLQQSRKRRICSNNSNSNNNKSPSTISWPRTRGPRHCG